MAHLFDPITLGSVELANRIAVPPQYAWAQPKLWPGAAMRHA